VGSEVTTRFTAARAERQQQQQQQRQLEEEPKEEEEEPEEVFDVLDWIDENLNYVFAGAVTMGVLYISMTIIGGILGSTGSAGGDEGGSDEDVGRTSTSHKNKKNKKEVSDRGSEDSAKSK
jgi:hypothetical protein